MRANDYSKGIDGRGYALEHRPVQAGDQVVFGAWTEAGKYIANFTGTVTRVFKYAIQVNGLPVKDLNVSSLSLLNEGITGTLWFRGVTLIEYGQEVRS